MNVSPRDIRRTIGIVLWLSTMGLHHHPGTESRGADEPARDAIDIVISVLGCQCREYP